MTGTKTESHSGPRTNLDDLFEAAGVLSSTDRVRLADMLLASVDGVPISSQWKAEIDRRLTAYDNGEVKAIPGDQVLAELREKYSR